MIGVSLMPMPVPAAAPAHPTRCRTAGTATEPSSRWWFSSSAIMWRHVTAVPLSVATWRGRPSAPRKRMSSRRDWKSVVFEVEVTSR